MHYVGLDIHSKHISICVLNETGHVAHRARVREIQQMMQILARLPDRFEVCYEASCGYGHCHDLLRSATADDAEWRSGKFRARLVPGLDRDLLMDVGPKQPRTGYAELNWDLTIGPTIKGVTGNCWSGSCMSEMQGFTSRSVECSELAFSNC